MTFPLPRVAARRIACAVVAAEIRRVRGADLTASHDWPDSLPIGDDGLGLDSIEQLGALGALAEMFGLDDAGLTADAPRCVGAWIDWIMRRHASGDAHLTVMTSGSTGNPLPCRHDVADLIAEARFFATQVPGRRRIVALIPAHHIYGIILTALLPAALDVPVVSRAVGMPLDLMPGDLVVAVPEQWQTLLRLTRAFPADVVGISSAGPLDDRVAAGLHQSGLARLLDIYGSSETGGIAMRELPAAAYDLLPRWALSATDGGDWRLIDGHGGRHDLPDRIERIGERGLRPTGRCDGAVQVAGHNVWPARVAEVLRGIDGVADAAVRLHVNGRLKAFIVPDGDRDLAELATIVDHAATARLTTPERPRQLRFGAALPRNAMGKLEDWT